jgi:nitrate/nitrite transporter NarK
VQTAIRTFPIGVVAFAMSFTGSLAKRIEPKWLILGAQVLIVIATVLFQYADTPASYWPYAFPAFAIGSGGAMLCYTHTKYVFLSPWADSWLNLF